jgi:putative endonuclease
MLQCFDGSFYVGITSDPQKRMWEHENAVHPKAYTASRRPLKLVFASACDDIRAAIDFEKQLKRWSHKKKSALARGEIGLLKRLSRRDRGDGSSSSP